MFKLVRLEDDHFGTKQGSLLESDKLEHYTLAFLLTLSFYFFHSIPFIPDAISTQMLIVRALGFAWEIKDGFFSHGFSRGDIIANELGIQSAFWLLWLIGVFNIT